MVLTVAAVYVQKKSPACAGLFLKIVVSYCETNWSFLLDGHLASVDDVDALRQRVETDVAAHESALKRVDIGSAVGLEYGRLGDARHRVDAQLDFVDRGEGVVGKHYHGGRLRQGTALRHRQRPAASPSRAVETVVAVGVGLHCEHSLALGYRHRGICQRLFIFRYLFDTHHLSAYGVDDVEGIGE